MLMSSNFDIIMLVCCFAQISTEVTILTKSQYWLLPVHSRCANISYSLQQFAVTLVIRCLIFVLHINLTCGQFLNTAQLRSWTKQMFMTVLLLMILMIK